MTHQISRAQRAFPLRPGGRRGSFGCRPRAACIAILSLLLAGCAGFDRAETARAVAAPAKLAESELRGGDFSHRIYARIERPGAPLRVYIEGDGLAWIDRATISPDPTPRDPVALRLAARDPAPNVAYVARPCQYIGVGGANDNPRCHPDYWTDRRFAPEVVASVARVMDRLKATAGAPVLELVGYSGGGGIAVLAAASRSDIASIRTVAGNLDHEWLTRFHRVSPMRGSLNPADVSAKLARVPQLHFVGGDDDVVVPGVVESYIRRAGAASCHAVRTVAGATHQKGWEAGWPALLAEPFPRC